MPVRCLPGLAALLLSGCLAGKRPVPAQPASPAPLTIPVQLGDSFVELRIHDSGRPGHSYLCLHDDENTAVEAGLQALAEGGRLVELRAQGERHLRFSVAGQEQAFDPNRVFTEAGVQATLQRHGRATTEAIQAVEGFARQILASVGGHQPPLVALHNNRDGGYSLSSYLTGGALETHAAAVSRDPRADEDDFFYTTHSGIYATLASLGANAVLEAGDQVADDGSLSVRCGLDGLAYVNVEAQHGHLAQQRRMLELLRDALAQGALRSEAPPIASWLLPDDQERCRLTVDYLRAHHPGWQADGPLDSCHMEPRLVVLHWTGGGSAQSVWDSFAPARLGGRPELAQAGAVNVAAHFLVERDGRVLRLLPERRIARHVIGLNHLAIGVENIGGPAQPLTDAQVEANIALVRHLAAMHDISHLLGHLEYRRLEGHAYFQERDESYRTVKSDPGPEFMARVRAGLADLGLEEPPSPQ